MRIGAVVLRGVTKRSYWNENSKIIKSNKVARQHQAFVAVGIHRGGGNAAWETLSHGGVHQVTKTGGSVVYVLSLKLSIYITVVMDFFLPTNLE